MCTMLQRAQSFLEHGGSIKAMTQIKKKKDLSGYTRRFHNLPTYVLLVTYIEKIKNVCFAKTGHSTDDVSISHQ